MGNLRTPYGNCPVIIADEFNPGLGRVEHLVLACDFESGQRRSHRCKLVEVRLELHIGLPALEFDLFINRSVGKQIILAVVVLQGLECESLSYLFLAAWMYGIVCTYVTGGYKAATFNLFGGLLLRFAKVTACKVVRSVVVRCYLHAVERCIRHLESFPEHLYQIHLQTHVLLVAAAVAFALIPDDSLYGVWDYCIMLDNGVCEDGEANTENTLKIIGNNGDMSILNGCN